MRVDRQTLLFFAASCLIAAARRPAGGSGFLLRLCQRRLLRGAVSAVVLWEAETTILARLPPAALATFRHQLAATPLVVALVPAAAEIDRYAALVNRKDAHVVAAALAVRAPCLLTLDQPFARELAAAGLPLRALDRGAFITEVLPTHPEAPHLRDEILFAYHNR